VSQERDGSPDVRPRAVNLTNGRRRSIVREQPRRREDESMPTIMGHHDISKGKDHWLSSPKREEIFGPLGITNIQTFVDPQNPNHVALVMDVPDLDAFNAAMQTEAAAEAMAHDGVMPETLVILVAE
jgi:hypothetical protein